MKAYTDINQSKKLAEILPLESADMHYNNASFKGINYVSTYKVELMDYNAAQKVLSMFTNPFLEIIPCWSLAALLDTLKDFNPDIMFLRGTTFWHEARLTNVWRLSTSSRDVEDAYADNQVDACYEMILKLKERDLL